MERILTSDLLASFASSVGVPLWCRMNRQIDGHFYKSTPIFATTESSQRLKLTQLPDDIRLMQNSLFDLQNRYASLTARGHLLLDGQEGNHVFKNL